MPLYRRHLGLIHTRRRNIATSPPRPGQGDSWGTPPIPRPDWVLGFLLIALFAIASTKIALAAYPLPSRGETQHRVFLPAVMRSARPQPFGYGMNVANLGNVNRVQQIGFRYVKAYLSWAAMEPSSGQYQWVTNPTQNDANNIATAVEQQGLLLVLRVDTPPSWAAPGSGNRPPPDPEDFGRFMGALAQYLKGRVVAYEIWNEPNLSVEWGGQRPNPEQYTRLLQAAYPKIKAADPNAVVISAGLATTGGDGGATAMDDLEYIRGMYAAGAKPYFDALGSHPYGFGTAPEVRNSNNVTDFQRAADQYRVMVENGDGSKSVWATEFGWLIDPTSEGHPEYLNDPLWNGRKWQVHTPQQQAEYLVQAFDYAYKNWPWMRVMLVFNLDFSTAWWYPAAEPMRFYSVLDEDGSPRPAYDALRNMLKPG